MRFLLDTHILLTVLDQSEQRLPKRLRDVLESSQSTLIVSVVSLWEIAIKARLGKLSLAFPLDLLRTIVRSTGLEILIIDEYHVTVEVLPEPLTRDPFDRLLLAQCKVEQVRLITVDRLLADHPFVATF